jgi:cell division septation protein DedD
LPPGILSVEVDGQPIDAVTVPVTDTPTPEISGRVELGVQFIELAVANGEVIRFPAELDGRGRFRQAVPEPLPDGQYALYINDVLIGVFTVQGGAADQREPGPRLDVARVVPYPADFGDLVPGIGFLDGRFYTLEEEAARTARADNGDVRGTRRRLAEAGWLQRYENRLAAPNADNPDIFDIQVSSFVVEYASGADARTAFTTLVGDEPTVDAATVGDESAVTLLAGTAPDTGAEYQAARLVFRVGPMLGMIVYADLRNQAPDLALLDTVAQAVAGRAAVVADRQSVPLGAMTLRLDPTDAAEGLIRRDLYDVRAGVLTALLSEDESTRESRITLFTGTTDAFSSTTNGTFSQGDSDQRAGTATPQEPAEPAPTSVISIEGEASDPETSATPTPATVTLVEANNAQVFMVSALYAFPGDAEAESWFGQQRERLLSQEGSATTFTEVPDAPTLGDGSATFATRRPVGAGEQTAGGFRIYARVGAIVAVLDIGSLPDMPLSGATRIMEMQVTCIEEQGCAGPASLPGRLFGDTDEAADEEPDQAGAAAEPTPGSIIIVEGDQSAPRETGEPRPTREPRERRNRDATEVPAG